VSNGCDSSISAFGCSRDSVIRIPPPCGLLNPIAFLPSIHPATGPQSKELQIRNVNYIVKEGEVIIVDEFTGRTMPGRRWSDGLHQAVEAKEGLPIQNENITLASVSYQAFFRAFPKLAGGLGSGRGVRDSWE
jgi:hypothetical protein